jgi:diaminopimelate decarboxylase
LQAQDLQQLLRSATRALRDDDAICTPKYVMCTATLQSTVGRLKDVLTSAAAEVSGNLRVQPCLSVKTQPNPALLRIAAGAGYLAECIDMAEVHHCVQNADFSWDRLVLTGPGKWWDCRTVAERAVQAQALQVPVAGKMHAIFADSLAELRKIVLEKASAAEVIGIRWAPVLDVSSRFGLDCKDAQVVRQAAELVATLPSESRLGMHFHHAPSALGAARWLGLARGFVAFCREFSVLCGRPVSVLDLGGGFEPFYLESERGQAQMRELMVFVHRCSEGVPLTVQFELGKCVSESAGGVLTRVLAVRERESRGQEGGNPKAIIIDSTVADLSVPNSRAVFWLRTSPSGSDVEVDAAAHQGGQTGSTISRWELLAAGTAEIWGRTCMEWDKVLGLFAVPDGLRAGDLLIIAGSGAYDMSMQYSFGDGVPRSENVILC